MEQLTLDLTSVKSEKKLILPVNEIKALYEKKTRLGMFGCPFWQYNFELRCTECRITAEREPDEGENLFRCDLEFKQCMDFVHALKVIK